jgi:hypothetical protein
MLQWGGFMRVSRPLFLLSCLLLTFWVYAEAQEGSPSATSISPQTVAPVQGHGPRGYVPPKPVRDAEAISVVAASLASMGSAANIAQSTHWIVQVQVTGAGQFTSASVRWKGNGSGIRIERSTDQGPTVLVSGHGKAESISPNGKVQNLQFHVIRSLLFPPLVAVTLLKDFQDTNYSLEYAGTATVNSATAIVVKTSYNATYVGSQVTPQTWYFDTKTGLPLRVEYRSPDIRVPEKQKVIRVDLSDYQAISGVLYPLQAVSFVDGQQMNIASVQSIDTSTAIADGDFDPPEAK